MEIGALEFEHFKKFQTFMEVRNQFMHNLEIETFTLCFEANGKKTYILKLYPQKAELSEEKQLSEAFSQLSDEVLSTTTKIWHKVKDKIAQEVKTEHTALALKAYDLSVMKTVATLRTMLNDELEKENPMPLSEMRKLPKAVGSMILKHWKESYEELCDQREKGS